MPRAEHGLALDTSVIVPTLLTWHDRHVSALSLYRAALAEGPVIVPTRVLVESFSVITRMPAPHQLAPAAAVELLSTNLRGKTRAVDFPADERWHFLEASARAGVSGGAVYDAEIVHTAVAAGARGIVTFDRSDFERHAPPGFEVIPN